MSGIFVLFKKNVIAINGFHVASCHQGSVAIAGAVVSWLKDNLEILKSSSEIGEPLNIYFSPVVMLKFIT